MSILTMTKKKKITYVFGFTSVIHWPFFLFLKLIFSNYKSTSFQLSEPSSIYWLRLARIHSGKVTNYFCSPPTDRSGPVYEIINMIEGVGQKRLKTIL